MRAIWAVLAMVAAPAVGAAATMGEEDTIVINPLNATDFEVIQGTNFGAAEFWCGAATYVERRTGRSEVTPIYVRRPRGPAQTVAGRNGVVFTTDNAGLPAPSVSLSLSVDRPGATLKSAQARRYCRDAFTRSTK